MTFKPTILLAAAALILVPGVAAHAQAASDSAEELRKQVQTALDWADGKLADYGNNEVTYTGAPITIRLTNHQAEVSTQVRFLKKSFAVLEKMSKGKLKIEARWAGTVHNVAQGFEANRSGLTDHAACFTFLNTRNFPLTEALSLPGLFPNEAVLSIVAEHLAEKYFRKEFERQGVYLFGITGSAPFNLFSTAPIRNLEELQGKKVRSGTGINQSVYEALGAVPVNVSSGEFYAALQRGLIDAVFTSDAAARSFRLNEVATHRTGTPINHTPLEWCMNRQTISRLPADLQRVFYNWARQRSQADTQNTFMLDAAEARETFRKQGMQFHQIAPEEWKRWQERYAPVVDRWITETERRGLPARELLQDIRALVAKYEKMSLSELMLDTIRNPAPGVSPVAAR